MSRPESVSSSTASLGSRMPICTISARFFSPPEKPTFTGRLSISMSRPQQRRLLARELEEFPPDSGSSPRERQQLLRFDREFHRQLLQHFLAEAVHDQRDRFFRVDAALHAQ
jgi:hypothetical protein